MEMPIAADWQHMTHLLETIRSFQTKDSLSVLFELRTLRSELKSVRLCQEKLLQAQISAGLDKALLSSSKIKDAEGSQTCIEEKSQKKENMNCECDSANTVHMESGEILVPQTSKQAVACEPMETEDSSADIEVFPFAKVNVTAFES